MAVVIDRSIESIKGNPLRRWSAIRHTLKSMTRVHLSAKVEATAARGQESSIGMCGQGAETETTSGSSESCLSPLIVIRVKTSELLEARPDGSIESLQSMGMIARWNDPYAVDHLAETGTASEQRKGDLEFGTSPSASRSSVALRTLLRVCSLQNSGDPTGPPSSSKLPVRVTLKSDGN